MRSLHQRVHALQAEWANIPHQLIKNLTSSMGDADKPLLVIRVAIRDFELAEVTLNFQMFNEL